MIVERDAEQRDIGDQKEKPYQAHVRMRPGSDRSMAEPIDEMEPIRRLSNWLEECASSEAAGEKARRADPAEAVDAIQSAGESNHDAAEPRASKDRAIPRVAR
uniref:Uncharacterized protein n=1 Tax=Methylocapsa acidiphila TaxID=133552 RepID=Q2VNL9_METAI|nr:hypothetical protein orf52 [Methylocapsa acidiphila]